MRPLGPIASYQDDGVDPTYTLYVDMTDRMVEGETITAAYVTAEDTGVVISDISPTTEEYEDEDEGVLVAAGQAVQFRLTVITYMNRTIPITVTYETSYGQIDTVSPLLLIKWKVK